MTAFMLQSYTKQAPSNNAAMRQLMVHAAAEGQQTGDQSTMMQASPKTKGPVIRWVLATVRSKGTCIAHM